VPVEGKVAVEQRKNYTRTKSFLHFVSWNINHLKLLKQKITASSGNILHVALLLVQCDALE
jgi:hypothetical protein